MTTVGILTGGGDCPGLNAVIRAVVRTGAKHGFDAIGIRDGWLGLVAGNVRQQQGDDVCRMAGCGQTPALDGRQMPAHGVHFADAGAAGQQGCCLA